MSGGWITESSGRGVVSIGDEIQLFRQDPYGLLGHITVPNPNYLCDISISAENLNYSINGVYYCEMGSSVSGKRDISINNYSDATGGNTNAGFNMNKCLSVSNMFTFCWELGYGGNMTLNNWNLENCGYMHGMLENATGKDKQVEMNDDFNYTTKFLIKDYNNVEKTTTYFSDNSQKTEFLTEDSGITNRAGDSNWYEFEILKINPKPKSNYQPDGEKPGDRCFFTHEFKITWTQLNDDFKFVCKKASVAMVDIIWIVLMRPVIPPFRWRRPNLTTRIFSVIMVHTGGGTVQTPAAFLQGQMAATAQPVVQNLLLMKNLENHTV